MQISDQLWTSAEAIKLIKCSVWRYSGKIHMYHRKTNSKHIDRSKSFVNIWAEKRRIMAWTCEFKCQSFIGNNNHHNYDIHSAFLTVIHYSHTFHHINSVVGHLGLQARWRKARCLTGSELARINYLHQIYEWLCYIVWMDAAWTCYYPVGDNDFLDVVLSYYFVNTCHYFGSLC